MMTLLFLFLGLWNLYFVVVHNIPGILSKKDVFAHFMLMVMSGGCAAMMFWQVYKHAFAH